MNNDKAAVKVNETQGKIGIAGSTLKLIAIVTMLIDHIAAVVLERIIANYAGDAKTLNTIYYIMRGIGRIAFPIFCFLLVEGFLHTRNVWKYALRLAIFALVSEIPFDLALHATPFYKNYQNVFFTLLIGLLVLIGLKYTTELINDNNAILIYFTKIAIIIAGMVAADLLKTDYSDLGVMTIIVMYLLRKNQAASMLAGCTVLTIFNYFELPAFLAVIPAWLYNGKRGLKLKYVFYVFYPAHLFILYLICRFMRLV